jgi:hypothetical protein
MINKSPSSNALKQQFSKKNLTINMNEAQINSQRERSDVKQNKKKQISPKNSESKFNKNNKKPVNNINSYSVNKDLVKSRKNIDQESQFNNKDNTARNYLFQNTLLNSTNNTNFKSSINRTSNSNFFNIKSPKAIPTSLNPSNKNNQNNLLNLNLKSNQFNNKEIYLGDKQENYNDIKYSLLAIVPQVSVVSPKLNNNQNSKSPLRKNFVKSTPKNKHPVIKIEDDNILNSSLEENKYNKINATERNLKSANPNNCNSNFLPGNIVMNQSVKNTLINSSNLNSTQLGSNVNNIY